jgi:hypothetical protein
MRLSLVPLHYYGVANPGKSGPLSTHGVSGLPEGEQAWIAAFKTSGHNAWSILQCSHGIQGKWYGEFATPQAALEELAHKLEVGLALTSR